ncbi:MAG: hypothetical protein AABY18_08515 [Candidatus Thermoplasmatota archaeon]
MAATGPFVYPYRNRIRWLFASRYAHLVHALDKRRRSLQDTTLESRVESIRFWNKLHSIVLVLLSIGVAATLAGWIARFVPTFDSAADAISQATTSAGAASGFLTILYLFVTRLLGQLEADVLTILTIDHAE